MSLGASLMNVFVAILWQVLCYVFFKEAEVSWEIELDKQKTPCLSISWKETSVSPTEAI